MSVNQMQIEDVYQVLNQLHADATGGQAIAVDTSSFVSVAQDTLSAGVDPVYNILMNTIAKTIFSSRPYSRQFKGLVVDNLKWGGIVRKVSYGDTDAVADTAFTGLPADGQSVDHYIINRGEQIETRFYGSTVYEDYFTVFREQLITSFDSAEQLGGFIAAKTQEINNKWTQWVENMARGMVCNFIMANLDTNTWRVDLLSEYNALTNITPALTYQDIWRPPYSKPFWEYVRARIKTISRQFEQRSEMYQWKLVDTKSSSTPKPFLHIYRHTPVSKQKIYMLAQYMDLMETSTLANTFNEDYLKYADVEKVAYWQDIAYPDYVMVNKYTALDGSGVNNSYIDNTSGTPTIGHILGIIFDEDLMGINIKDTIISNTPMNSRGLYFDTYLHAHTQYWTDFSEKGVVLTLD